MSSAKTHTFVDRYDVYSYLLHTLQQCSASVLHNCWEVSNQVVAKQSFAHMFCPIALPPRCAFHIRASVVSHIRAYSEHLTTVHACCLGCGRNWPGDETDLCWSANYAMRRFLNRSMLCLLQDCACKAIVSRLPVRL